MKASGVRIGTAAVTTRGLGRAEMRGLADTIAELLHDPSDDAVTERARAFVVETTAAFPIRPVAAEA